MARLQHPNIVTAYSAFRLGESIVFAMEYVEGLDLAKMLKNKGPLPVAHASYFVSQAAQGMQHAHEQGMVHRDIKPGNLMLSHKGSRAVVKVLDFGLAKATREAPVDGGLTDPGQALGTPDYMAPEQIRDAKSADVRADIYSLGCTLYYVLSGGPPFRGESLWDLYQAHHSMDAKLLNFVRPDVPSELAAVVAKMMAKEPGRRFQTPAEVAQALAPFFKKASTNVRPFDAEISQVGQAKPRPESPARASVPTQPATSLVPAEAPSAKKPAAPAEPETRWESLIEFKETEPLRDAAPAPIRTVIQKPRWLMPAAVAGLLLMGLVVAWATVVLRVKTANGTIVLENVPEDAIVEVDGKTVRVIRTGSAPIQIEIQPGEHAVRVKRGKDVLLGESVTIESGKHFKLTARIEPPVVERPQRIESRSTKRPDNDAVSPIADSTQFSILSGRWDLKGDELVQADASKSSATVTFGDDRWKDYDFTVDLMKEDGRGGVGLCFRSSDENEAYVRLTIFEDKECEVIDQDHGFARWLQSSDVRIVSRRWYTARVHIRGDFFACSLYDQESRLDRQFAAFTDDRHPCGRVGLETFGSSVRFKNIKATSPDERVLWEGLPGVASTAPPEASIPVDQPKRSVEGRDGFVQLFNGVDLAGWKTHPQQPGNWHVENGILVGSGPAAVSHLYTIRDDYKDFHLRAQVRINDAGKSGVYIRASFGPSWPATDLKFPVGYEAQIYGKPGDLSHTGSLLGGAKVFPVDVPHVRPFEWFTLEVIARGNHVVVKVNDTTTADYTDTSRLFFSGHIALQQYSAQTIVEFRKIEIKEFSPSALPAVGPAGGTHFIPLFNGTDLGGWVTPKEKSLFTVEDGEIVGRSTGHLEKNEYLVTQRTYGDFVLKAKVKLGTGNSGVQFRSMRATDGAVSGPQADVGDGWWGRSMTSTGVASSTVTRSASCVSL